MSQDKRSFWASIPGLITGIAGLLTGVVGLITLGVQQGIIGKDSDSPATTVTTATAGSGAGSTPTTEAARFTVDPTLVRLAATDREKTVTVRNTARSATITVLAPEFGGADRAAFRSDAGCTNVRLAPAASCTLKVLFTPSGLPRQYRASLVLKADGVTPVTEVPIETSLLGT